MARRALFLGLALSLGPFSLRAQGERAHCPSDADSARSPSPTDVVRIGEHVLRGVRYVSILVDGQRAVWNELTSSSGSSLGPDLDPNDIKSVEVVKSASARLTYGACPGVGLLLITTKSKTWRPNARQGANPSPTEPGKAIVPPTEDDSLMAILDAYSDKRVSATAAAKVIVDYMVGTGKPLNIQMDAELRAAVAREMKARRK